MTEEKMSVPHDLTLSQRERLTVRGICEVLRFDEESIVLRSELGILVVHGTDLRLKTLSLEGGQVAVTGSIQAIIYQQDRPARPGWRRLLQ